MNYGLCYPKMLILSMMMLRAYAFHAIPYVMEWSLQFSMMRLDGPAVHLLKVPRYLLTGQMDALRLLKIILEMLSLHVFSRVVPLIPTYGRGLNLNVCTFTTRWLQIASRILVEANAIPICRR